MGSRSRAPRSTSGTATATATTRCTRTRPSTSQLALPEATCRDVYATSGYGQSAGNLIRTPIDQDIVVSDGSSLQMATVTGSVASGHTASLNVPV